MINKRTRMTSFIDWNSQVHEYGEEDLLKKDLHSHVFSKVGKRITKALAREFPERNFHVALRIYHGWHKGFEPTLRRKIFSQLSAEIDFSALSPSPNVVFSGEIEYGSKLISAKECRLHPRLAVHLPNTLRSPFGRDEEKMVDTAIASDLIAHAVIEPESWLLVAGEDDDLVPPLLTAESFLPSNSRVLLLRKKKMGPFLRLESILLKG